MPWAVGARRRLLEVVAFEKREAGSLAGGGALDPEVLDRQGEEAPHPLAVEVLLHVGFLDRSLAGELRLGAQKIERAGHDSAAALLAAGGLSLAGGEVVQAGAEEGAEAGPLGVVGAEGPFCQGVGEELLGEVGGVLARGPPLDPQVLVDRFPVALGEGGEGLSARLGVGPGIADGTDDRVPGRGERPARQSRAERGAHGGSV